VSAARGTDKRATAKLVEVKAGTAKDAGGKAGSKSAEIPTKGTGKVAGTEKRATDKSARK
jgi:hypothetical protein